MPRAGLSDGGIGGFRRANSRTSCVIFIEQNLGPHIEQKCAVLAPSAGSVWSWNASAVSGSRLRLNWSRQRNSKRARDKASSCSRVGGELVGDDSDLDVVAVWQAEVLLGRDVAKHRRAEPADHRRADAAGDMVVARGDVGDER